MPTVINPTSLTFSDDAVLACQAWLISQVNGLRVALNGAIDAATVTVVVSDASNITGKDTILIDGEAMLITNKVGKTLTVTRGGLGTTAATHANNAKVDTLKYPDLKGFCAGVVANAVRSIMDQISVGTLATQDAAIQTAQQAKAAAKAAAVQ